MLLERIETLRSRGLYEEAVREIERSRAGRLSTGTRERLSYELGAILGNHVGNRQRACRHWRRHEREFAGGRYYREVQAAKERLGCE